MSVNNQRFLFNLTLAASGILLLSACSNSKNSITPLSASTATDTSSTATSTTSTSSALYAYASNTTLAANSYTYVYAQGGTSPYTYSIASGDAVVNSTSGYVTVNSTGNVVVQVKDAAGATYQVQLNVGTSTTGNGTSCVYLSTPTQQAVSPAQSQIDLQAYSYMAKHVIVGLGLRIDSQSLVGIYSKVAKLNGDGTISTTDGYIYKTGNLGTTTKGEIYIDLPAGYYLTGVGFAANASGTDVEALKLYGDKVDSTGTVTSSVQCAVDQYAQLCTAGNIDLTSKSYYSRYSEFRYGSNKPVVTWGAWMNNYVVGGVNLATKTITPSTMSSGLCPQ